MKKSLEFLKGDENLRTISGLNAARKSKSTSGPESLDAYEIEDEGFIEGDIDFGTPIATFNFGMNDAQLPVETPALKKPVQEKVNNTPLPADQAHNSILPVNLTCSSSPRGLTPPINGENFTVKRSYSLRPTTVRKLNSLKAEHPDVNVLFNTIVDMAISHYYDYIFNEGRSFVFQEEKNKNS
jgi:hypothetical protein